MKSFTTLRSKVLHLAAAAVLVFATVGMASAATIISFDQTVDGGTLSYGGNVNVDPLVGTNIRFDEVTVGSDTFLCTGCLLNFTTGVATAETAADLSGEASVEFGPGGSFILTGTIFDGAIQVATGTLLSGVFVGTATVEQSEISGLFNLSFEGDGLDEKNPDLLAYLGLPGYPFVFASTAISASGRFGDNFSFSANVTEADLTNIQTVPEPSTMFLSGFALLALGGLARRRAKKA